MITVTLFHIRNCFILTDRDCSNCNLPTNPELTLGDGVLHLDRLCLLRRDHVLPRQGVWRRAQPEDQGGPGRIIKGADISTEKEYRMTIQVAP